MEQLKWETKKVKVKDLIQLDINPRKISEDKKQKLVESLEKFNLVEIPAVNTDLQIIGGNQRVTALLLVGRGEEEIDVRYPNRKLTKKEVKEYAIISNTHAGEFDFEILDLEFADISIGDLGFEIEGLDDWKSNQDILLAGEAQEDDFDEAPPEIPITVLGDLYEIGEHRLLCGDSTDSDQVAKLMNGEKADMVFTDPPYFSKQNLVRDASPKSLIKGSLNGQDSMFAKIYDFDEDKVISTLNTLFLVSEINTYFCCSQEQVVFYLKYAENLDLKYNILIWRKPNNVINKDRFSSSIEYIIRIYDKKNSGLNKLANNDYYDKVKEISRYIGKEEKVHHTQKPIELCTQFIELSSNINKLLYEPFAGSGSTMVASHQLKRKCYGMELDCKYVDVIIKRMLKLDKTLKIKKNGIDETETWIKLIG